MATERSNGERIRKHVQKSRKRTFGHGNNFCFYTIFYFTALFFNPLFFAFVQELTAGENLKVAGDSAGRRHILTTLHGTLIELIFSVKIQLKTLSGTLGGIKTHYKLDGPKIIHLSHCQYRGRTIRFR